MEDDQVGGDHQHFHKGIKNCIERKEVYGNDYKICTKRPCSSDQSLEEKDIVLAKHARLVSSD